MHPYRDPSCVQCGVRPRVGRRLTCDPCADALALEVATDLRRALRNMGVQPDDLRNAVRKLVGR